MIHIILLILKILGIILLSILSLILLLVCIVLFVPLRYKVEGTINNSIESLQSQGRITWLFKLIHVFYKYEDGEFQWDGRIAWYDLDEDEIEEDIKENIKETKHEFVEKEKHIIRETKKEKPQNSNNILEDVIITNQKKKKSNKLKEFKERCGTIYKKIIKFFKNIKYTFRRFCDTISNIYEQKEAVITFFSNEIHKYTMTRCKEELLYLWKHTKPKKLQIKGEFGFEDPSVTGKTLAIMSVCQCFYGKDIQVTPNFEEQVYIGDFLVKGNIRIVHLVMIAFRLMKDKKVRITYKHIKKLKFFNNEEKQEA